MRPMKVVSGTLDQVLAMLEQVAFGDLHPQRHHHVCEECHHVFAHGDECAGSDKAHLCPVCHAGPWFTRLEE